MDSHRRRFPDLRPTPWSAMLLCSIAAVRLLLARSAMASAPPEDGFVSWLEAHPEVEFVSVNLISDNLPRVERVRISDREGGLLCAIEQRRPYCIRVNERFRHVFNFAARRDAEAGRHYVVGIGPLDSDPGHVATFEFRLPAGTVHAARRVALSGDWRERPPIPVLFRHLHGWTPSAGWPQIAADRERGAAKDSPSLPLVSGPAWLTEVHTFAIYGRPGEDILRIAVEDQERVCLRRNHRWSCAPRIRRQTLSEAEPTVPPQDKRLPPEGLPSTVRAVAMDGADASATIFTEREWERERIAHTYRHEGSFLEILRWRPGTEPRLLATLRTARMSHDHDELRNWNASPYLFWRLLSPSCVELLSDDLRQPVSPALTPGRYCVRDEGVCRTRCSSPSPLLAAPDCCKNSEDACCPAEPR